jgi:MFS family permease
MPAASSISALLYSVLVLIAGNGLLNTLVPLRGKLEGFADLSIGLLGAAYFAGMLAGTLAAPAIILRAGYIRAFSAFVAVAIVITLIYPYAVEPVVWVGLRYAIGFVFSGFYAVIEAWLTDKSDNTNRGRVYALYQIVTYAGTAGGQQLLAVIDPHSAALFSLTAALFALAMLPMAFTKAEPPPRPRTISLRLPWLMRVAPVASVSALCIGCANGSFWAMAPVYGLALGLSSAKVATFITAVIFGTALALYPVGRLSDRMDRRKVLVVFALAGAFTEILLALAGTLPFGIVAGLGFAVGATTMVLYMLAVSHANDRAGPEHAVTVSSGMLFLYCFGAIIAPIVASMLMARFGASALFVQNAAIHVVLVGFALWRIVIRRPAAAGGQLRSGTAAALLRRVEPGRT